MERNFICFLLLVACTGCSHSQEPSLLQEAVIKQNYQLVEKLLNEGANPNERDQFGGAALQDATMNDDTVMIKILMAHGADIHLRYPPSGESLLGPCVALDRFSAAKYLIEHGLSVDSPDSSHGQSPLLYSISLGKIDMVSFLLNNGANPNFILRMGPFNETPLSIAIFGRKNLHSQIQGMEDNIATRDSTGDLWRMLNLQIIQILLKAGASTKSPIPLDSGTTYLHEAAAECDIAVVKLLLQYGADKNAKDDAGERPYDIAVKNGCKDLEAILK
jgi:ankyrin repeat protein